METNSIQSPIIVYY